ncbi:MAG: hypothetical protein RTU92_02655 [Candidatus Thorarchaeota archaeon]
MELSELNRIMKMCLITSLITCIAIGFIPITNMHPIWVQILSTAIIQFTAVIGISFVITSFIRPIQSIQILLKTMLTFEFLLSIISVVVIISSALNGSYFLLWFQSLFLLSPIAILFTAGLYLLVRQ